MDGLRLLFDLCTKAFGNCKNTAKSVELNGKNQAQQFLVIRAILQDGGYL
jgi:hypothetical protein